MTIDKAKTSRAAGEPRRVAVLGAPGTGKTRLAGELMAALSCNSAGGAFLVLDDPSLADVLDSRGFDRILLMGLDLPAHQTERPAQDAADQRLRQALTKTDVPYTVVYGMGPARLAHALEAVHELVDCSNPSAQPSSSAQARRPWVWTCDTCSDPDCERRLLSDLLASRTS